MERNFLVLLRAPFSILRETPQRPDQQAAASGNAPCDLLQKCDPWFLVSGFWVRVFGFGLSRIHARWSLA